MTTGRSQTLVRADQQRIRVHLRQQLVMRMVVDGHVAAAQEAAAAAVLVRRRDLHLAQRGCGKSCRHEEAAFGRRLGRQSWREVRRRGRILGQQRDAREIIQGLGATHRPRTRVDMSGGREGTEQRRRRDRSAGRSDL